MSSGQQRDRPFNKFDLNASELDFLRARPLSFVEK